MRPHVSRGCKVSDKWPLNRTWDEYASELTSGHLSWTPVHDSDLFWKDNVTRLNEKDYFYLKYVPVFELRPDVNQTRSEISSLCIRRLIELLRSSQDPIVLAVAAHDLGQYVKYYELGKKCVFRAHIPSFHLTY